MNLNNLEEELKLTLGRAIIDAFKKLVKSAQEFDEILIKLSGERNKETKIEKIERCASDDLDIRIFRTKYAEYKTDPVSAIIFEMLIENQNKIIDEIEKLKKFSFERRKNE